MHLARIQCQKGRATSLAESHGHNHTISFVTLNISCNIFFSFTLSDPGFKLHLNNVNKGALPYCSA